MLTGYGRLRKKRGHVVKSLTGMSRPNDEDATCLAKGQRVRLSGTFLDSSTDCVSESSLTLDGSLTEPEFIFRFSRIASLQ
jgi:hypothetical protein